MIGKEIKGYKIGSTLGKGGFGIVMKGYKNTKVYALKILNRKVLKENNYLKYL
jgi:serine/threonine protein kinase